MSFSISIIINLKNNTNHLYLENLIHDTAYNCNTTNIYTDFELEGINNYIKKNNKIKIVEFDNQYDLCNFITFIKLINELIIETIYNENNIIYCTNKYINGLNNELHDKEKIKKTINNNINSDKYKEIYKTL